MNYQIDYTYDLRVLPSDPASDFFNVEVAAATGTTAVQIPKLAFQKRPTYIVPKTLACKVKAIGDDGLPLLRMVVTPFVFYFYEQTFRAKESFQAEVVAVPEKPSEEPYMLRDANGLFLWLNDPEGLLSKGQMVRCRFKALSPHAYKITRIDEAAKLPFFTPEDILAGAEVRPLIAAVLRKIIDQNTAFATIRTEVSAGSPLWPVSAARIVLEHLPEWYLSGKLQQRWSLYGRLLDAFRDCLLFLLEGSGYLNAVPDEQRRAIRQQLTDMTDSLEPYAETLTVIARGEEDSFVETILDRLHRSGYLYHPARRFAVLMLIFRLHPDKVGEYLNRIFESIFSRDLDNWKREPFRSAFVEQFKIYVSQTRRELDALPLAETREQKLRLETIITAIALQHILSEEKEIDSRSQSLFFRYIALLRPLNSEALLSKAFLALMGAKMGQRPGYAMLKEPMMMMTQATVMPAGDYMKRLVATHRYSNGLVDIAVSTSGIKLSRTLDNAVGTETVIPEGLMEWLRPQIALNGVRNLTGQKLRRLSDHHQWWHDIETSLLDSSTRQSSPEPLAEIQKRHAEKGDDVYVVIDGVTDNDTNNPTLQCHISDADFDEGRGIIKRDQIVGYNLKLRRQDEDAFLAPDGSQRGYLARVLDIRPDGSYIFSLREEVDRFLEDFLNYDDTYLAIIAGQNDQRDYSALARDGFGLFLERTNDVTYNVGDVVRCRISHAGKQGQIRAYILEKTQLPEEHFNKNEAFANLMRSIGECEPEEPAGHVQQDAVEELTPDVDERLTPDDVRELIEIIRFKAISDNDLIVAYDYLRFARLMALAISDTDLAERLSTHATLLQLHQYFAINSCIDAADLAAESTSALSDPLLRVIFHRLEMVSWLGINDRNAELYAAASSPANELEGFIARMVLSYNMLYTAESTESSPIASDIKQEIMKKLNVNNETRQSKYYGTESKYLEFKTSIVYPAKAPGQKMEESPETQQFHILSRIAGMLNADGGRLYLGVNDEGYEVGMHDDFKYYERHNASVGRYSFKIKTIGNMKVYIENLINEYFDESAARKITVSIDDEASKGVIQLDISQSLTPVFLADRLWVRQSGEVTQEYHGKAIEEFVAERAELRAERDHLLRASLAGQEAAGRDAADTQTADNQANAIANITTTNDSSVSVGTTDDTPAAVGVTIETSLWRPNVLHSYESGYAEPFGYLYFVDDNKLIFSTTDLYLEPGTDNCRQALVIPHDISDNGYLIIAYENERALRIPLAEIYEKGENIPIEYNTEYKPLFATVASKDDALVCVGADSSSSLWRRANKLSLIDSAHLMSTPKRLHDAPIHHTVAFEIADPAAFDHIADCFADTLATRRFGVTMRVKETAPSFATKLEQLRKDCAPTA